MKRNARWAEAQESEFQFWTAVAHHDFDILQILADNSRKAATLKGHLKASTRRALEVGCGPLGVGIIAFLSEIPLRFAMDPLQLTRMDANETLAHYIDLRRESVAHLRACGEEIPIASGTLDLVICCNVIDHTSQPNSILGEICRILRPGGQFFFDVDTFSLLGLVKWHTWTKFRHKGETLVKAHPYRMVESVIQRKISEHGFALKKLAGHTGLSACIGKARSSTFHAEKQR